MVGVGGCRGVGRRTVVGVAELEEGRCVEVLEGEGARYMKTSGQAPFPRGSHYVGQDNVFGARP